LLVGYHQPLAAGQEAILEVNLIDLPGGASLGEYLAGASYGIPRWQPRGEPENLTINGVSARRFIFASSRDRTRLDKEIVVFERGSRSYFFVALFSATDETSRQEVRRAVDSVYWR
jgi:hypothetical protein